eukprot:10044855-Alexandrium_andersonii.AAC.1
MASPSADAERTTVTVCEGCAASGGGCRLTTGQRKKHPHLPGRGCAGDTPPTWSRPASSLLDGHSRMGVGQHPPRDPHHAAFRGPRRRGPPDSHRDGELA